jgi:uncharacterized protein YbjT (DUF2867 family)
VLVTGATGTVGSAVLRLLHEAGIPVVAAGRDVDRLKAIVPDGVASVRLDLTDPSTWTIALRGATGLFLMRPPQVARASMLAGFIAAAQGAELTRVAFLSVQGAGVNPAVPHRRVERLLETSAMDWTFLRAGYFHQNLITVHAHDIRCGRLALPAGQGRTAVVDARDVAAVAVAALTQPGHRRRAYELCNQSLTWAQMAEVLTQETGHPVSYTPTGAARFIRSRLSSGEPLPLALVQAGLYTATRWGLAARTTGDLAAILDRPPTSLAQFARTHADHWA